VVMTDRSSFTNQQINTIVPNAKADPSFLYYSLRPRKQELLSLGATTGVRTPILNKSAFCDLFGKIRPYFHKVCVAPFDGVCSADTIVIRSLRPEHYSLVVACVSSDAFVAEASATANGAKMPRANWEVLKKFQVVIPKGYVAEKFSVLYADTIKQLQTLIFQSHNLRRTRDLLLPRLLSGQVPVAEVALSR
jgi:type I restriction enzyme S subunit